MRGLKLNRTTAILNNRRVASFTDAWIETLIWALMKMMLLVASFTDAWIETISEGVTDKPEIVASFTDAWIETVWKESCVKTR